jgi:hypothetical protein
MMNRRQFLGLSATSALFAGLTGGPCEASVKAAFNLDALARPDLLSILDADAVRAIGLRYRRLVPCENHVQALHAAIVATRLSPSPVPWLLRPSIADMVRDDFAAGRTIVVHGWVLSATEARQSALFSLLTA